MLEPRKRPALSRLAIIVGSAAALAAALWAFRSPSSPGRTPPEIALHTAVAIGHGARVGPGGPEPNPVSGEPGAKVSGPTEPTLALGSEAPKGAPKPRPRSPLESSPGYYPPDDPESMSVVTGRRDAPPVDLELTGGASSIEDLARMLLAGIGASQEMALHALRLSHNEFTTICWPEFPESRPVTHITAEDAWEMSITQSLKGASQAVASYGGRQLELVRVESAPAFGFQNFTLYRNVTIVAKDIVGGGALVRLHFASSIVERHGRFKALIFKD